MTTTKRALEISGLPAPDAASVGWLGTVEGMLEKIAPLPPGVTQELMRKMLTRQWDEFIEADKQLTECRRELAVWKKVALTMRGAALPTEAHRDDD